MGNQILIHSELSSLIIKAFYNVYNRLGYGFLEKVYRNAMLIELKELGLNCAKEVPISVFYKDKNVGDYFADILVENTIILELKAAEAIVPEHEAQVVNYLRATELELGFLLNFGPKAEYKRRILTNAHKTK